MTMVLIIFTINLVYVTFYTVRLILTMKGYRWVAAGLSVVEIVIYVVGLGLVLDNLNQIQNVAAYAIGYGTGVIIGSMIEEKLALGYVMVNVITEDIERKMVRVIRENGFGITDWEANGRDGSRHAMQILTPKKYELKLYTLIKELDPKAFIITYEARSIHGGFWVKQVRKGKLFK
ncbi:DUF2179 domain-containing protein [Bhargavaea cecembensis]|uniref:DUF2179 domain-containing protein n=1 Tax=Bhargavaea cecembensis TaxID=394098 RepID=UPI00058D6327|nr:DUF2179 domain-containing protein [Bhargavaea cecembensis]